MTYFNLKIEFLDQLLLLLVVKTVMGHKNIIIPFSFLFLLFSAFRMSVVCLSRVLVQVRALRGQGGFSAC